MKILIVSQRYWPENFRITDIAETLVQKGHDVTVLCGLPNYPQGKLYKGYEKGGNRIQEHNGVHIIRAKEIERRTGVFFRFLNYYSFPHYAKKIVKKLGKGFDLVLANELSPIMSCEPALYYKKLFGAPVIMYEMDLWPESLLAGGIKKGSLIYNHYKKISARIYSGCDKILVSTNEHIDYIKSLPGCAKLDIDYLPQYAEELFERAKIEPREDDGTINLMFAGNIGKAQSVQTIIKAAALLNNQSAYRFHIVGDGSELNNARALAKKLRIKNVTFYGSLPLAKMPELYKKADIMIVSLVNSPYAHMTIPGKIQSYLACGKPVVCSSNGASANLIESLSVGLSAIPENPESLASAINSITKDKIKAWSQNAKKDYFRLFSKKNFFDKLESSLFN